MEWIKKVARKAVSGTRNRYQRDGYDLDLTYITDRIIAMGFPAEGVSSMYRNNIDEVARFCKEKHPNHFMIFNLTEDSYDYSKFDHQVLAFGFPDHHSPPLDLLFLVCKSIHAWLTADAKNVAMIHCLAGKGRTGTVISCYLLYSNVCEDPASALKYFAYNRDSTGDGVTSPSQKLYVEYFYQVLKKKRIPEQRPLILQKVILKNLPSIYFFPASSGCSLLIEVFRLSVSENNVAKKVLLNSVEVYELKRKVVYDKNDVYTCKCPTKIHGDILVTCRVVGRNEKVFRVAFHTGLIPNDVLRFTTAQMDDAFENSRIPDDFTIEIIFDKAEDSKPVKVNEELLKQFYGQDFLKQTETKHNVIKKIELKKDQIIDSPNTTTPANIKKKKKQKKPLGEIVPDKPIVQVSNKEK